MATTLADIEARVRTLTGIESTAVLTSDEVKAFVNEAQYNLLGSHDWPFLIEQQTTYAMANDSGISLYVQNSGEIQRVIDVFVTEGGSSDPVYQVFERAAPFVNNYNNVGWPKEFEFVAPNRVEFYPAPDLRLQVVTRFLEEPPALDLSTDESVFPDRFVHAVSYLAAARILEREGDETERPQRFEFRAYQTADEMKRVLMTSARKTVRLGGRRSYRRGIRRGAQ